MTHIIDTIADERDRLRAEVKRLRAENRELRKNQCGEQVGWHSVHVGTWNFTQKPNESWNPKPVYLRK